MLLNGMLLINVEDGLKPLGRTDAKWKNQQVDNNKCCITLTPKSSQLCKLIYTDLFLRAIFPYVLWGWPIGLCI